MDRCLGWLQDTHVQKKGGGGRPRIKISVIKIAPSRPRGDNRNVLLLSGVFVSRGRRSLSCEKVHGNFACLCSKSAFGSIPSKIRFGMWKKGILESANAGCDSPTHKPTHTHSAHATCLVQQPEAFQNVPGNIFRLNPVSCSAFQWT